jgi:hypothetical protein
MQCRSEKSLNRELAVPDSIFYDTELSKQFLMVYLDFNYLNSNPKLIVKTSDKRFRLSKFVI